MSPAAPLVCADALSALIVLRPMRASRNRHFALFTTPEARAARKRAQMIRSVVRELAGGYGPVRAVSLAPVDGDFVLRYTLGRVALMRTARLTETDLAIVRIALAARGVRLLPSALVAREEDHALVAGLLARGDATIPT